MTCILIVPVYRRSPAANYISPWIGLRSKAVHTGLKALPRVTNADRGSEATLTVPAAQQCRPDQNHDHYECKEPPKYRRHRNLHRGGGGGGEMSCDFGAYMGLFGTALQWETELF